MKYLLKGFLSLTFCCLIGLGFAQQQPAKEKWNLKECVDYGIKNNLTIQQSQLQVESSQSTYKQSKEGRLPSVTGNANETFRTGRSIDPFTNQLVTETVNSTSIGVDASMILWNGFRQTNTIKQNETTFKADQLDVEQSKRDISLNIATAYLQVLLNQELLKAANNQVLATKGQLDRTEKLFTAGTIAENQVIDLKAQLASDEIAIINAENALSIAKLNLMQLMNLPVIEDFEVESVDVATITNEYDTQTPQQIYQTAESGQYNIQSADLRIKSSDIAIGNAKSTRYPTLALGAGISSFYSSAAPERRFESDGTFTEVPVQIGFLTNDPNQGVSAIQSIPNGEFTDNGFVNQMDFNLSSYVSLRLTIPIYNSGQIRNNITQAQISKKRAELQSQNTRIQLRQNIEQAYNDMRVAQKTFEARQKQVESLDLAFKTTETRFNVGASNSVDYNLSKINLDRARADLIRAKYDYVFRIKVLDFYVNKPIDL